MPSRTPHSPTTAWCSPPAWPAEKSDATASKPNCTATESTKSTPPNHPTTCGKVERSHQALKNGSPANPAPTPSPRSKPNSTPSPPNTTTAAPTAPCSTAPPQRSSTPAAPKPTQQRASTPTTASAPTASTRPERVTLRVNGRLHHIGIGRHHHRTRVLILAQDPDGLRVTPLAAVKNKVCFLSAHLIVCRRALRYATVKLVQRSGQSFGPRVQGARVCWS
ncbi:hypothetical protein Mycch_4312 [Mycolicibacterium chubuense NBB4]|uniref:Uncharacterized protein n=1 Tax=Mycolicibacterium chubuense (strain NBB4) TaxID=710421 RepID=I4BP16_MYCCN|nr:hypothetical protein Mycch_4312 [Mycolicibacterium chubuense NBB4]